MAITGILRNPKFTAFDSNGVPLSGGKAHTYEAGTTTPVTTYSDYEMANPNANPVVLDSRGEADVWFEGPIKVVLKDSDDVTIWTFDDIGHFSIAAGSNLNLGAASCIVYEGTTADEYELTVCGGDPTADRTQNHPDGTGTLLITPLVEDIDGAGKYLKDVPADINAQTGTTYTILAADNNRLLTLDNAAAITLTLPPSLRTGFTVSTMQKGAGTVSYSTAGSIISKNSATDQNGQGTGAVCVHLGSNVWWVCGDLA